MQPAVAAIARFHEHFDALYPRSAGLSKSHCIFSALAIRDFLRTINVDAEVQSVILVAVTEDAQHNQIVENCGNGGDQIALPGRWLGHLVVTVNGHLIDAAHHHIDWPEWLSAPPVLSVPLNKAEMKHVSGRTVLAGFTATRPENGTFTLAWLANPANAGWQTMNDALTNTMRDPIVARLLSECRATASLPGCGGATSD